MRSRSHGWMCNRRPSGSLEERGIEPARRRYGAVDNTLVMCGGGTMGKPVESRERSGVLCPDLGQNEPQG